MWAPRSAEQTATMAPASRVWQGTGRVHRSNCLRWLTFSRRPTPPGCRVGGGVVVGGSAGVVVLEATETVSYYRDVRVDAGGCGGDELPVLGDPDRRDDRVGGGVDDADRGGGRAVGDVSGVFVGCDYVNTACVSPTGMVAVTITCWRITATTATFPEAVPENEEVVPVNAVSTWVLPSGVTAGR